MTQTEREQLEALFPETRRAWKRLRRAWLVYRTARADLKYMRLKRRLRALDDAQ